MFHREGGKNKFESIFNMLLKLKYFAHDSQCLYLKKSCMQVIYVAGASGMPALGEDSTEQSLPGTEQSPDLEAAELHDSRAVPKLMSPAEMQS